MKLPRFLLRETATIAVYEGDTGVGPSYADAVTVRCFREDKRRMVRDATGTEVTSETTIYCPPGTTVTPESRVTVGGRTTTVITVADHDTNGLPTPDHVEVNLR